MEISDMIFWLTEGSAVEYLDLCCQEFQEKRNRTLIYALDLCVAPRRYSYSDKKRKELVRYWRESHGNEYFPSLNLTDYQSFPNRKLIEIFRIRREGVHLIDAGKYSFFLDFSKSILERLEMKWELKTAKHFLKHLKAYNDYTQKSLFPILDSWDPGNVTFEKPPIVYPSTFIQNYFMNLVKKETGQKLMKLLFENLCADSSLVVELFHTMCVRGFYKMHLLFKAEVMEYIFYHCKKEKYHITHFFHALREESLYKTLIRSSPKHLLVLLKYGFKFIFKGDWQFMYFLELYPTMNGRFYMRDGVPRMLKRRRIDLNPRESIVFDIFAHFLTWGAPDFTVYMECVRNIWRSVPDAFISFDEIRDLLLRNDEVTNVEEICDALRKHEFSSFDTIPQPRCLSHYSRCVIRSALMRNSHLPDGISHLGLPKQLEAYLNLELD